MPMSSSRSTAATESLPSSDDGTKWPESTDCTAMRALSASDLPTRVRRGPNAGGPGDRSRT